MNAYQRKVLTHSILVVSLTGAAVVAMVNIKDVINRSEAMRAMEQLSSQVDAYRAERGVTPGESYIEHVRGAIQGQVRLGDINYRAQWLGYNCKPEEILAYVHKNYRSLLVRPGYVVLYVDGSVEWVPVKQFREQLRHQQSELERQLTEGR